MSLKLPHLVFAIFFTAGLFASITLKVTAVTFEEQIVSLINSQRQNVSLASYKTSTQLTQAAQKHNNLMLECSKKYGRSSCFAHQVTLLSEPTLLSRISATGYNPKAVAENIAWGYTSPTSVVNGWMGSSGHRANILGNYKDIGCDYLDGLNGSYTGMYWTCVFGTSYSLNTSPTSNPTNTPTPTPTKIPTPTPTKSTPTPTPITTTNLPSISLWWCKYVPTHSLCTQ